MPACCGKWNVLHLLTWECAHKHSAVLVLVDALSAIIAMFTIINFVKVYNILVACNKNTLTKWQINQNASIKITNN